MFAEQNLAEESDRILFRELFHEFRILSATIGVMNDILRSVSVVRFTKPNLVIEPTGPSLRGSNARKKHRSQRVKDVVLWPICTDQITRRL